jgi:hypothetical protein
VEQVRQEPVPEPRLNRALARARRLRRQSPSSRFQRVQLILALTTLAAVLLLSLLFLMHLALLSPSEVKGPPAPKKPKPPTPKGDGSIQWLGGRRPGSVPPRLGSDSERSWDCLLFLGMGDQAAADDGPAEPRS